MPLIRAARVPAIEKDGHVTSPDQYPKKNIFPWDIFGGHYYVFPPGTDFGYGTPFIVTEYGLFALGDGHRIATRAIMFEDEVEDAAVELYGGGPYRESLVAVCRGQLVADGNVDRYNLHIRPDLATADFFLNRRVAGALTTLWTEAVDVPAIRAQKIKCSVSGSTIACYRNDMTTPKGTVTDTAITGVGRWGTLVWTESPVQIWYVKLLSASSEIPKMKNPVWTLLPIIGKGTRDNPYRPKLPERIADHPVEPEIYGKINELATSYSAIIPCDKKTGKPLHPVALCLIGSKTPRKIEAVEMMIEEELKVNRVFAEYSRKVIPEFGQKTRLSPEEAKKVGKLLNPKLPDDFVEKMYVVERE